MKLPEGSASTARLCSFQFQIFVPIRYMVRYFIAAAGARQTLGRPWHPAGQTEAQDMAKSLMICGTD